MISIVIPVRTVSEANAHEHWRKRQRRAKEQRGIVALMLGASHVRPPVPCVVTITRIAPGKLDDDNLAGSQKHVRDGIADWLGVNDRDPRVKYEYAQRKGKPKEYAVQIEIMVKT